MCFQLLGCALIQIPDYVVSLYRYFLGSNGKVISKDQTQQRVKSTAKRNYKPHDLSNPKLVHFNDQEAQPGKDTCICKDKSPKTCNQVGEMNQNYDVRFCKMEEVVSDVMDRMSVFEKESKLKYEKE